MLLPRIAAYARRERTRRLPEAVRHHAKRAVIDWFAALLAGGREAPAALLIRALAGEIGHGRAVLYPSARRATPLAAALINGTASHTVEFDDIFRDAIYHPGAPTIAAALAVAQARGATGDAFLRAVIVGYEVSTRIGVAVQPSHYKYWHTTGTIGCIGAAAAAASVLGLDKSGTAHALATAATFASGLQQAFRSESMSKPLHAGHAAQVGVLAALGAQRGITGALDVLDGPAGFGAAMSDAANWPAALDGLGRRYNIAAMTFKNHGCCGHSFAAIDAVLALRAKHGLAASDVARVMVKTYKTALDVTGSYRVRTAFEGKFSLPFVVATALIHGSVRLDAFSPKRLKDAKIHAMMKRVQLAVEPEIDAAFPKRRAALVEIETKDGRRLRHFQPTRKGDPDAPLSDAELDAKFLELATPAIGAAAAGHLLSRLWTIDTARRLDLGLRHRR
ncbi:MAG: MmgE/PrpD family protein [Proteobacteria bacterium]|nr:MmgE/PrpD family protein [Pseudomonadota bacterium]